MSDLLAIFVWLAIGYLIGVAHTFALQLRNIKIVCAEVDLLVEQNKMIKDQNELIERLLKT